MEIRYKVRASIMNHLGELNNSSVAQKSQLILMTFMLRFDIIITNSSTLSIICIDPKELWATADTSFLLLITLIALKRVEEER